MGLVAIQVANYVGATPIVLTRTSPKRGKLQEAGAKHVIVTDDVDFMPEVKKITGGQGARVAFDPVGGTAFSKLISTLSFQGIVYLYGALDDKPTTIAPLDMIAKMPVIKGHNLWVTSGDEGRRKAAVKWILEGIEAGGLKPVIDRTFKFDEMVEVHRYLEKNGQFGKIVVTV